MSRKRSKHKNTSGPSSPSGGSKGQKAKKWEVEIYIEPGEELTDPRIDELLKPIILDLVLLEDVASPLSPEFDVEEYLSEYARRLREPIAGAIQTAGNEISKEEMDKICRRSAGEVLVVRGLGAAIRVGEITLGHVKHLGLYHTYKAYFDQSPEIIPKFLAILANMASSAHKEAQNS